MKFILIELYYELNNLKTLTYNSVRKIKKKYYIDCLFKIKYNNEYLTDVICELTKKVNLEKLPLIINSHYDTISFLNLTLPKMNNVELLKNIDLEISNLIMNYKNKYRYLCDKVSASNNSKYRVILMPKIKEKEIINRDLLKIQKTKKVYETINYNITENIFSKYKYKNNINYATVFFNYNQVEISVLCNGKVIEYFTILIESDLLNDYNLSHNYEELLNVNNQYFKSLCDFINGFVKNRTISASIIYFSKDYNEYLINMIDRQIYGSHYLKDYSEIYASAFEDIINE